MAKLTGKVAVVTGAAKGIGAGVAKALAAEGAKVVVNYAKDHEGAKRVVDGITADGGQAVAVQASVAHTEDIQKLIAATREAFGKIDILVNNAGVYAFSPIESISAEEIARQFGTNVSGLLLTTSAALPLFPAEGGSIINVGSVVSQKPFPQASIYSGTKGAVDAITAVLAQELGPRHIRVNSVNPGLIATEGNVGMRGPDNPFEAQVVASTPLGRIGQPDDIADVVTFLASDESRWVNGSLLQVAGGAR